MLDITQDNAQNRGMYSEWISLSSFVQNSPEASQSVLEKFGITTSKEITLSIVHHLATNLGISQPPEPSPLLTDSEVQWCMEVLCYGLSLPLTEHDAIKDCVNVYCEWLSALLPNVKICVPKPVCDDPNLYARKIIKHFHYLFIPRKGEGKICCISSIKILKKYHFSLQDWSFLYQEIGRINFKLISNWFLIFSFFLSY